jgi:hypothetical protein
VNFFFYRPPMLPPEKRYDDVLYKFIYNGRQSLPLPLHRTQTSWRVHRRRVFQ